MGEKEHDWEPNVGLCPVNLTPGLSDKINLLPLCCFCTKNLTEAIVILQMCLKEESVQFQQNMGQGSGIETKIIFLLYIQSRMLLLTSYLVQGLVCLRVFC